MGHRRACNSFSWACDTRPNTPSQIRAISVRSNYNISARVKQTAREIASRRERNTSPKPAKRSKERRENQFLSLSRGSMRCLDVSACPRRARSFVFLSVIIDPGFIYREAVSRRDEFPRALDSPSLAVLPPSGYFPSAG